ncbi:MAG: hypothetical protein ABI142_12975 [Bryocella sp.]
MGQQITSALHQSMHRVLLVLASFLPGILVFLAALLLFGGIGLLLSALARRLLTAARFDERLASKSTGSVQSSFSDWSPSHSPTLLITRAIFWLCLLAGIAIGISAVDASSAANSHLSAFLWPYLTHLMGSALLVFFGTLLARFLSRSVLVGAVNAQLHYARFLALGVKWLVLVLTAAMALDHLQIGGAIIELAFGILFGGIVLTLALAIGLGSRDLVSRSIEKTMERPLGRTEPSPTPDPNEAARSRLRHF